MLRALTDAQFNQLTLIKRLGLWDLSSTASTSWTIELDFLKKHARISTNVYSEQGVYSIGFAKLLHW